jgi:hypothetical protein
MSRRSVKDHYGFTRVRPVKLPQEDLEALSIKARQIKAKALSGCGLDGHVKPQPLVLILVNPRRTKASRTPSSTVPDFQAKPCLVHGKEPCSGPSSGYFSELIF